MDGVAVSLDYRFREGIIVPEPSAARLVLAGALLWLSVHGRLNRRSPGSRDCRTD